MSDLIEMIADSVDGLNWQAKLNEAFLIAVEVAEGLREADELIEHIQTWWYEVLP